MNNIIIIIVDSARYDSFLKARLKNINKLGMIEKRYSYASWTSPSHYVFLMGIMPHTNPSGLFASEVYKKELSKWTERIGVDLSFKNFIPELSLPKVLKSLGYRTIGRVSLPVLNKFTTFSTFFDDYKLMDKHNDFAGIIEEISISGNQPSFYFLNIGEAHYPYALLGEDVSELPRLHGVHGVFKHLDDLLRHSGDNPGIENIDSVFFDSPMLRKLHEKQIVCIEYVDELLENLFKKCPDNTYFVITSDHGEMFGEENFFGHGPVMHEKVFEVPFVEGILR